MRQRRHRRSPARPAAVLLAAALLAGCGTSTSPSAPDETTTPATAPPPTSDESDDDGMETSGAEAGAGATLTEADHGTTLTLAPGEEATLRLAPPFQDAEPVVDDPSIVELVVVEHFADPGYAEYGVLAGTSGSTTVRATADGQPEFTLQVVVEASRG